jgi:hypothetical protein
MRLSGTKANSTNQYRGLGDQLYDLGGARPTLDLNFANNESLVDSITGKDLVTHTRASSATYVDGGGNIKTAVTNYFEASEGFGASGDWGKTPLRGTATDNAATAPDGTNTATLLVEDTQTAGRYINNVHNFVANTTYTVSCWAKQYSNTGTQDRHFGLVFVSTSFTSNRVVAFNLTGDGSFTTTGGTATASIEAYPDGWYRCSLTATATTTASTGVQLRLSNNPNNGTQNYTGDGVSGIYVWGAQLEESSTVGEYVKTTGTANSTPRFDHDPVTGESLGLLVEDARTNLVIYSAVEINNGWQSNIGGAAQNNTNLSLNKLGVFNGVRSISEGQTFHGLRAASNNFPTLAAGTTYTITNWWMRGDVNPSDKFRSTIKLNGTTATCEVKKTSTSSDHLDVNSYTIVNDANHGTISNLQVEDAGSNVIKLSYNFVPANSGAHLQSMAPLSSTVGASIIVLAAQIEEGVNPSSYIHTSGSTVTRAADNVNITGSNFSSWYNTADQKGTAYGEGIVRDFSDVNHFYFSISDGSLDNEIRFFKKRSTNKETFNIQSSGINQLNQSHNDVSYGQNKKGVIAFEVDNAINALDGTLNNLDTTVNIPVLDQVHFGFSALGGGPFMTIKRFTYWPDRVSNDTVIRLTE